MPANIRPSELSRDIVHVELRDNTSIWFDGSAAKRADASRGMNVTLAGSPKIAAATARQMSTSKPVQMFLSSMLEKPRSPWLTPQLSAPRSLTAFRVCAPAGRPPARTKDSTARVGRIKGRFSKSGIWISRAVGGYGVPQQKGRPQANTTGRVPNALLSGTAGLQ